MMAKDLNKCAFIGRLGRDVELKYTTSGTAIANISIACSDDYKKDGQKVEQTNWINLVFFGKLAEIAGQYLSKGSKIYAEGKMVPRKWQDNEGNDRWSTEVRVSEMQMLGGNEGQAQQSNQTRRPPPQNPSGSKPPENFDDFDDD